MTNLDPKGIATNWAIGYPITLIEENDVAYS